MRPYSGEQRKATWVEALAVADRGRLLASWELQGAPAPLPTATSILRRPQGFGPSLSGISLNLTKPITSYRYRSEKDWMIIGSSYAGWSKTFSTAT